MVNPLHSHKKYASGGCVCGDVVDLSTSKLRSLPDRSESIQE